MAEHHSTATASPSGPKTELIIAAENADWGQVVGNGGPPCFHFEPAGRGSTFCLRAQRWHGDDTHKFVSLDALLTMAREPTPAVTETPRLRERCRHCFGIVGDHRAGIPHFCPVDSHSKTDGRWRVTTFEPLLEPERVGGCQYAGPGRGDCEHFVGFPGISIPGQHDGPDTLDVYGRPNGWCWYCWQAHQISVLRQKVNELEGHASLHGELDERKGGAK